jgi:hypothetical protein
MNGMLKSISHPKIAAPGEAFNSVWHVEQIANAALLMNTFLNSGDTAGKLPSGRALVTNLLHFHAQYT